MFYSKIYGQLYSFRKRTASALVDFFSFRSNQIYLALSLMLQVFSWYLAYFIFNNLSGELLVLHYNVNFGINWIGDAYKIFYFPAISLSLTITSIFLLLLKNSGKHLNFQYHIVMASSVLSSLGMNIVLILIYLVNFK